MDTATAEKITDELNRRAESYYTPAAELIEAIHRLSQMPENKRLNLIQNSILKLSSAEDLIKYKPEFARAFMSKMTKLLPLDTPSFTSDSVTAHKRENYDSIYTLVIFFNKKANDQEREAKIHIACKKGWAPEMLASHWLRNPEAENNQWASHRRRVMLPYLVKTFRDVEANEIISPQTRDAATQALENMHRKIGRIIPELFAA